MKNMQCHITTLAENTAGLPYAIGEWGFSALVESDEMNVLLDTGVGYGATHNADLLGIDLTKVDKIILSHSHFDHTEGLPQMLKKIKKKEIEIIAAPDLWTGEKYSVDGRVKAGPLYIGIPYTRFYLENFGAKFTLTREPVKLTNNIMTIGEIPIVTDFEKIGEDYLLHTVGDKLEKDDFSDDRALIINTDKGLTVILGCGHRCLINTLYHAQKITGVQQIHMVIGGCHLIDASEERIRKTIDALKELNVEWVGVSHCTGLRPAAMMAHELGDRFFFNTACNRITIPFKGTKKLGK
jgi:7,8-dihydropterin-6-yl-methyl-4-(beta-D-ribofuranosyl)aminobenzene 5'-phosphate synthase